MKKHLSLLFCLVLIASVFTAAVPLSAAADCTFYTFVGEDVDLRIYDCEIGDRFDQLVISGSVPGVTISEDCSSVYAKGTATTAGTFTITLHFDTEEKPYEQFEYITFDVSGKNDVYVTKTYNFTVGQNVSECVYSSNYQSMDTYSNAWNGLRFYCDDYDRVLLEGKPSAAGSHTFSVTLDDYYTDNVIMNITVNVSTGKKTVDVTKTYNFAVGEKVDECVYVSNFSNLDSYTKTWNGLTLNSSPGDKVWLSGTPAAAGNYTFSTTLDDYYTEDVVLNITVKVTEAALKVTKSPSGETRTEGENALFISAAENYSKVEWRVVTKDGSDCWRNKSEIEGKFTGVKVSTYQDETGRECLALSNIPLSMDGYYIQTKFWSMDESKQAFTEDHSCLLTVKKAVLKNPVISAHPQGAELENGKAVTLSVTASSPDGNVLKYQWYKNTTNSSTGGEAITGATSSKYTPDELEGTMYYYCAVTNTKGNDTSAAVYSNAAAVKYPVKQAAPVTPSPSPEVTVPVETPVVVTPDPVTPTPTPSVPAPKSDGNRAEKKDHTALLLIAGILVVAMVCGTLILLRKRQTPPDDHSGLHDGVNDEEDYRRYLERKKK